METTAFLVEYETAKSEQMEGCIIRMCDAPAHLRRWGWTSPGHRINKCQELRQRGLAWAHAQQLLHVYTWPSKKGIQIFQRHERIGRFEL